MLKPSPRQFPLAVALALVSYHASASTLPSPNVIGIGALARSCAPAHGLAPRC